MVLWDVCAACLLQSYLLLSGRYLKLLRKNPIFSLGASRMAIFCANYNCVPSNRNSVHAKFFNYKLQPAKTFYHAKLFMKMMNHKRVNKICICITAQAEKAHTLHTRICIFPKTEMCDASNFLYIFQLVCQL